MITINEALKERYQQVFPKIQILALKATALNWPHFMLVPESYAHSETKLMVVGQQTKGWGPANTTYSTVEDVMLEYSRFEPARKRNSPFWRAVHELNSKINQGKTPNGFIWSNLVKIAWRKGRPDRTTEEAICGLKLLQAEFEICKPDVAVFFTGPNYKNRLLNTFTNARLLPLTNLICRISHADLPYHSYCTYHPAFLQRSKQWDALGVIAKYVLMREGEVDHGESLEEKGVSLSKGTTHDNVSASHWLDVLKNTETANGEWKKAVNALSAMGLRIVPALIEATGNEHPEVRQGASKALHQIGPRIIPFLMKALRNDNSTIREGAARGLYGFAPHAQKSIPALTRNLGDSDAFVRQWVATALERLAHYFGPTLNVAIPGLVSLLKDEDFMVRKWAAHALGSIGAGAEVALPALASALKDEESLVQEAASLALKEIQKSL